LSLRGWGGREGHSLNTKQTVLATAIAVAFGCTHAQSIQTLEPVVVTASKIEEPQGQATVLVEVIDRKAIEQSGAANITELLDQVSGGILTRQYGRLGVDAAFDLGYLGGASAHRTLILVNGVPINDVDSAPIRWGQIPLDAVEQVEIRKAGGGVLFGDRSLGGVVNIITRRAEAAGSAHLTIGSFNTRVIGLGKSVHVGDTLFQLSAQGAESGGYRASVDQKIRSLNLGVSQPTPLGVLGVDLRSFEENTLSPDSIPLATFQRNPRAAPTGSTTAKRDGSGLNLWLESNITQEAKVRGRVSYDESKNDVVTSFSSFTLNKKRYSGDFSLSTRLRNSRVLAGLEFFDAAIGSTRSNLLEVEQQSSALYLSSETPAGESLVNLGVRQQSMKNTFTRTAASGSQRSREDLMSWSIGGLSPIAASVLRYSIQSSFSFPNTDQLYTFHPTTFAPTDINPGIRPMKSDEAQVALSRSFGGVKAELGSRFLKIKDEIGFKSACSGAGSASCNTNLFDTKRLIAFASVGGTPSPRLSWSLSADSIQSTVDSGTHAGKRIPMVPKLVVRGSASWKQDRGAYRVLANHRGNMVQSDDFGNTGFQIPSRVTLDAGYTHTWPSTKLELAFWVRNLTDRQYFDFASFQSVAPADGRSIELRIKQDF